MGQATALTIRGRSVVSLRAKLPLLAAGAPESWVEMAYASVWKGHPSGEFAFTGEALSHIVARFDADENPLPVTYGHPEHSSGKPVPAAGWIREMEVRAGDDGAELWGRVEWTDTAAQHIRAGEYRYCSVVVDFAPIDRASGEPAGLAEMYELGLTNSPFLPGMTPITLSRVGAPARPTQRTLAMDPTKVLASIATALGLKKDASPDKMKKAFDALVSLASAMFDEPLPETPELVADEAQLSRLVTLAKRVALMDGMVYDDAAEEVDTGAAMLVDKLMTLTGMDAPTLLAAVEANGDALVALLSGTAASGMSSDAPAAAAALARDADRGRIVELTARANAQATQIAALTADLAKRTAAETEARIAASFSRLLTQGKAGESERATFLSLSAQSESIALSAYDTRLPVLPPSGQVASGAVAAPAKATTHTSTADVSQLGLTDPRSLARQASRSRGLKGAVATEFETRWLAKHAERHTSA